MRKKTLKIFVNSFVVSLFTIWAVNGLFAVPEKRRNAEISIPDKNIALFFQHEAPTVNYSASTPVRAFSLAALAPKPAEREIFIDKNLFVFDDEEEGIRINSVEDAADIPLEYSAAASVFNPAKSMTASNDSQPVAERPAVVAAAAPQPATVANNVFEEEAGTNRTEPAAERQNAEKPAETAKTQLLAATLPQQADSEAIPLEFGNGAAEKVEIASKAPDNQIAMADGGKLNIDKIAVEQTAEATKAAPREWYEMSEKDTAGNTDSPWVVAKGTRNPKNNHVLDEDFYKGMSESEINAALNAPEKIAEDGKEVQVAEMVKNILIPIPEDIMNDKNLTPQLVSPKKNKKQENEETAAESDTAENDGKSGGLLKSLASMFGSSDENTETAADDNENLQTEEKPKKRRGLFSAFSRDKSPAKILPAEMRLSFQPGRAEISGTTLRWIQAFANKVIEDPSVILEIRIDRTSSFELQQKRLNLLHNILTNKGVEYEKINTVFTSREPNSFIIRTLRINENVNNTVQESNKGRNLYYQSW